MSRGEESSGAAIALARDRGPAWIGLDDATLDCARSVSVGDSTWCPVVAPSLREDAVVALLSGPCAERALLRGVLDPMSERTYRTAVEAGLVLPRRRQTFWLSTYAGPENDRALAYLALGFGSLAMLVGSLGYVARWGGRRSSVRDRHA